MSTCFSPAILTTLYPRTRISDLPAVEIRALTSVLSSPAMRMSARLLPDDSFPAKEECEEKLAEMILQVKAEIAQIKGEAGSPES